MEAIESDQAITDLEKAGLTFAGALVWLRLGEETVLDTCQQVPTPIQSMSYTQLCPT